MAFRKLLVVNVWFDTHLSTYSSGNSIQANLTCSPIRSNEYMSMTFAPLPLTTENLFFQGAWGRMFGHFIESGREKAGLSIEQAAVLAGMSAEDWAGLE